MQEYWANLEAPDGMTVFRHYWWDGNLGPTTFAARIRMNPSSHCPLASRQLFVPERRAIGCPEPKAPDATLWFPSDASRVFGSAVCLEGSGTP